jgi:hypothetical protein
MTVTFVAAAWIFLMYAVQNIMADSGIYIKKYIKLFRYYISALWIRLSAETLAINFINFIIQIFFNPLKLKMYVKSYHNVLIQSQNACYIFNLIKLKWGAGEVEIRGRKRFFFFRIFPLINTSNWR